LNQGLRVRLNGLPHDEFLDGRDCMADKVNVVILEPGAEQRFGYHREGHFHQLGIDIDGAEAYLAVKFAK